MNHRSFVLTLLSLVAGCSSSNDGRAAKSTATATRPSGPPPLHIFVSNERSNDVSVIDAGANTVIATIPVGKRPRGLHVSRDGKTLYVALSGSPIGGPNVRDEDLPPADKKADGIGMVDIATRKFIGKFNSGSDPEQFALSADERFAYVANEDANAASVVELKTRAVIKTLKVGTEPEGVAITPNGARVYVTSETSNTIHVIDTTTNEIVAQFKTAGRPRSVAFTPDGQKAYVTCENAGTVDVVSVQENKVVKSIAVRAGPSEALVRPMGIVMALDGKHAFVTTGRGKSVVEIATDSDEVSRKLHDVGERPWGINLSPDGKTLYTANGPSNDVSVIDVASLSVRQRITAGNSPWGITVAPTPTPG